MMTPLERKQRLLHSLAGVAVGDAFGRLFAQTDPAELQRRRSLPDGPWPWTDDTAMAISVVECLLDRTAIDGDLLCEKFVGRFREEPQRGYSEGMRTLLNKLLHGGDWRVDAPLLHGTGSVGNGAAVRAAPVGAFFSNHPARCADEARASAAVTHAHTEAQAGAIAVAVAGALMTDSGSPIGPRLLEEIARFVPEGRVRGGIDLARTIGAREHKTAQGMLGTGGDRAAFDTVPFCLWLVANHGGDFGDALWLTAAGGGDLNTTCAIVGGILGAAGREIPHDWIHACEPVPAHLRFEAG